MSDKIAAEVGAALHRLSHAIAAPVDSLLTGIEDLKGERDEALAEVEQLRADLDAAAYRAGQQQSRLATASAERDAALAVIERVRQVARDLRPSTLSGLLERALDDPS